MGEFRVTDLMKSRSPKKPTPITQPSGPEPARKPRHVRTQLTHHSPLSPTPHPSTVEMGMRDYWDLGLRFRWFIFTWLLFGLSV